LGEFVFPKLNFCDDVNNYELLGGAPKREGICNPEGLLASGLMLQSPFDSTRETSRILTDCKDIVLSSFDPVCS